MRQRTSAGATFPFNLFSQRVGRVRSGRLTQTEFQRSTETFGERSVESRSRRSPPNRRISKKSTISSQKSPPTHPSNPYPVKHRRISTKNIGFGRLGEMRRFVKLTAIFQPPPA
ncbi:hypothetical protein [Coleofasciculus sp.]|uniref:hypothetical protein n=1 Tax=Coleofasciculus sp. TaxID=3100458 RepID=UPI003A3FA716